MKTGSCSKCGYLSLCDEHRKQALADNFDAIKNMSRPANPPTPTVLETSFQDRAFDIVLAEGHMVTEGVQHLIGMIAEALRAVEREALERAAKLLLDREKDLESATGNTYLQRVECNVMARAIQKLGMSGDSTS